MSPAGDPPDGEPTPARPEAGAAPVPVPVPRRGAHRARDSAVWVKTAARSVAGGIVAIALVSLAIVALQRLVPTDAGSPAVVRTPGGQVTGPPASPFSPSPLPTSPEPDATPSPSAEPSPTVPADVAPRLSLTVLNNTRRTGLAARAAQRFESGGWDVVETGNYRGATLSQTTVYYEPGQGPSAERLRKEFPDVRRALPRPAGLPGRGLTVVLAADWPG